MKLIILKNNLTDSLNCVERAVGIGGKLPILKNILIKGVAGKIYLEATDLEIAVSSLIPGKVVDEGSATVPFGILNSVIKNLTSERLTLEAKDSSLIINTENYEAVIQGGDVSEFPIIPQIEENNNSFILPPEFLSDLGNILPATQYSEIRPEISGVFFSYEDSVLTLVATDSFRLVEKKITNSELKSDFENISFILPLKSAEEILRVFKDGENLKVLIEESQICVISDSQRLVSRLVDGKFPDYKTIIPKESEGSIYINRQEFAQAVKLVSSFSGKNNDLILKTGEGGKHIEISSTDSFGGNNYRLGAKIKGKPFEAVFNWRYIYDSLGMYKNEEIILGFNSPDKPVLIHSELERSLIYVVMPIRK